MSYQMPNRQQGFSLVELMIAITLGLMLMAGLVQMFLGSRVTFSTQQAISRVQETGRLAIEMISRDVRMAGFAGCLSRKVAGGANLINTVQNPTSYLFNFTDGVHGYTSAPASSSLSPTPLAGSHILTLTTLDGSTPASVVTVANTASDVFVRETAVIDDGCSSGVNRFNGFCPGDFLIISDCESGVIFQVTSYYNSGSNIGMLHAAAGAPGNAMASWDATDAMTILPEAGGFVNKINRVTYFVAQNTAGVPSLYQNLNGQNLELLENVEKMALRFGIDTTVNMDGTGDGSPDEYKSIGDVTSAQWNRVVSVRMELLIRSAEDNVVNEVSPYTFDGVTVAAADIADKRMRQVFVSTMGIRNRVR